ncbi:RNA polymerase sigma factor [Flexithrix dorotheae]|uniref:RNA polymerase sigma factor n=1 Tax=Flexithrix dorotheae TaxID=70993 RepID=UPI0012FA23A2|nr:sigma-70 family RNA polymerase sigma factor [Flexithrix dorotheae]
MASLENEYMIWLMLKRGQPESIDLMVTTYYGDLYYYGLKLSQDNALVEDCIQEVLVNMWEKRSTLEEIFSLKPYLIKSLKRRLIRKLSNQQREIDQNKEISTQTPLFSFSKEDTIITQQDSELKRRQLLAALSKLSNRQREIIYLKFYGELDYEEIVEVMALKRQSVHNLLQEAIKSLRNNFFEINNIVNLKNWQKAV